jgi:Dolichyl-phosphate-mannose-protein mannosyltransferase
MIRENQIDPTPTPTEISSLKLSSLREMRKSFPIVVLLLCTAFVAECVWFIHTQSFTYDEPVHVAAGLDAWRNSRFQMWNDHPPLARLWCALPLLNEKWEIHVYGLPDGFRTDQISPDPEALAWRARAMNVVFGLTLGLLLWNTARKMFSSGAAILALALFVSSPAVIAHFSLATTDGAATLFIFLTAVFLLRWRASPSLANTICFGVVLGALLLSKFSTPVILVIALLWMLILIREEIVSKPWKWNWGKTLIALLLALVTVWAGYFFHVSRLTLHDHELITTFPNRPPVVYEGVKSNLNFSIPVPAGEYLEGFRSLIRHNRFGQIAFFLGRISRRGFKFYFPVAILLKWPIIMLMLFAVAAVLAKRKLVHLPSGWWVMMSFPLVYLGFAIFSRFDIGDRHVLPIYPFMLLLACSMWEYAKTHRVLARLVVIAVLLQAVDTLRYAPDYLSYFNVYVPPMRSYELLSDSNLDWGQGLLALRKYQRSHPDEQISLAYFGSVDPRIYGIQARTLHEGERVTGTVVISASNLSGQFLQNPAGYHWVLQYPLKTVLNHSLYVFDVPAIRP